MKKIDLKKELKHLYRSSEKEVSIVDVPDMNLLMINGKGDPNSSKDFQAAVEALYAVSYALKFMFKKRDLDWVVMPLEGLWWMDDWTVDMGPFINQDKNKWQWTMMIMQPQEVTEDDVNIALKEVEKKKNPSALSKLRFEGLSEGKSVQIMHIGPYSAEEPTILKMHDFANKNDYQLRDKHHEIYLSDPRKVQADKLKTILRHPVKSISKG